MSEGNKNKNPNTMIVALACALILVLGFSAMQTLYIFALTTGKKGNMTYTSGITDPDEKQEEKTEPADHPFADPNFSLEEAAKKFSR